MNRQLLSYYIARFLSILYRPLTLYLIDFFNTDKANDIGLVFINATFAMLLIQSDSYRFFYRNKFDNKQSTYTGFAYHQYLGVLTLTFLLGFVISMGLACLKFSSPLIVIGCGLYFLTEKFFDEILRYWLFDKSYNKWAKFSLIRLLSFFFSCLALVFLADPIGIFICFSLNIIMVFIFVFLLEKSLVKIISMIVSKVVRFVKIGFKAINKFAIFWGLSIAGSVFNNYDRIFTYFLGKDQVAYLLIIFMLFSSIQLVIEFFFTSTNRKEILNGHFDNLKFLYSRDFILKMLMGSVGAVVLYYLFHYYNIKYDNQKNTALVISIIIAQILLAITAILKEIVYWRFSKFKLLKIEAAGWVLGLIFFGFMLIYSMNFSLIILMFIFDVIFFLRVGIYIYFINKIRSNFALAL